jgi:hypothetical protein
MRVVQRPCIMLLWTTNCFPQLGSERQGAPEEDAEYRIEDTHGYCADDRRLGSGPGIRLDLSEY